MVKWQIKKKLFKINSKEKLNVKTYLDHNQELWKKANSIIEETLFCQKIRFTFTRWLADISLKQKNFHLGSLKKNIPMYYYGCWYKYIGLCQH